jgi:penicillin amidase
MKVLKFLLCLVITVGLIYLLDNRWVIKGNPVPPLGKLLDPFHGFWQNLERDDVRTLEELTLAGLKGKVSIVLDSLAIPHVFAENDEDLYFAQGYVTAMHRLWQMELQTHAAAGRVSEIVGPIGLNNDRYMRRLGMGYGAAQALQVMQADPKTRMIVEQYTNGINAYIQTLDDSNLPFEYKLLDYKPEPWTPLKCALVLMNMSRLLNIGDKDIEMTNDLTLFFKYYV